MNNNEGGATVEAELIMPGTFNGNRKVNVSDADIDAMIANHGALSAGGLVVNAVLGHEGLDVRDGQPAVGRVSSLFRRAGRLVARFSDVPKVVAEAIRRKLYSTVSVEFYEDVSKSPHARLAPGARGKALSRVAILGATIPAVRGLKDLEVLMASEGLAPLTFCAPAVGDVVRLSFNPDAGDTRVAVPLTPGRIVRDAEGQSHVVALTRPTPGRSATRHDDGRVTMAVSSTLRAAARELGFDPDNLTEEQRRRAFDHFNHVLYRLATGAPASPGGKTMTNYDAVAFSESDAVELEDEAAVYAQRHGINFAERSGRTIAMDAALQRRPDLARALHERYRSPLEARPRDADAARLAEEKRELDAAVLTICSELCIDASDRTGRMLALDRVASDPRYRHLFDHYRTSSVGRDR